MGMAPIWGIRSLSFILSCVAQATGAAGKACAQVADDVAQATAGAAGAAGAAGQACAQVADDIAQATAGAAGVAGAAGQACAQVADDVAQATAGAAGAVGQASAQVADDVAQATGAAGAAGQAGAKVSREVLVVVNVAFLMFDALDLGYTIRDIFKNKGSEAAKILRKKANKIEASMKQ